MVKEISINNSEMHFAQRVLFFFYKLKLNLISTMTKSPTYIITRHYSSQSVGMTGRPPSPFRLGDLENIILLKRYFGGILGFIFERLEKIKETVVQE